MLFGSIDSLRPSFQTSEGVVVMQMAHIIEVLMLSVAALILLLTGTSGMKAAKSSVFNAGMQAVVAISVLRGWAILLSRATLPSSRKIYSV